MYALILDDSTPPRHEARRRVDEVLERPLDPELAEEYDRERWGTGPEAIEAAAVKDAMFGAVTFGD
ncbi:MAG TPA: hypothetical protein VG275_07015 [Solirubrobacteraceae bacterium]|nr:hypothetical protein [Solirubrobacteraceae bacterium]